MSEQKTEAELAAELHKSIEQELIAYFRVGGIYKSVGSARWALYANSTDVNWYRLVQHVQHTRNIYGA